MKKRLLAFAALLLFVLAGCGQSTQSEVEQSNKPSEAPSVVEPTAPQEITAEYEDG